MRKTRISVHWFLMLGMAVLLIFMGIYTLDSGRGLAIGLIVAGSVIAGGYALVFPVWYRFTDEGITVGYCFGYRPFLRWEAITRLKLRGAYEAPPTLPGRKKFQLPARRGEYEIGYFPTRCRLYRTVNIPRTPELEGWIRQYVPRDIVKKTDKI